MENLVNKLKDIQEDYSAQLVMLEPQILEKQTLIHEKPQEILELQERPSEQNPPPGRGNERRMTDGCFFLIIILKWLDHHFPSTSICPKDRIHELPSAVHCCLLGAFCTQIYTQKVFRYMIMMSWKKKKKKKAARSFGWANT